jgi:hypothetical protein
MSKIARSVAVATVGSVALAVGVAGGALAAADPQASCVGLASSFFAGDGVRNDVAQAIKVRFGIPPGAEVSRFARVQLHDLEACLINGQG